MSGTVHTLITRDRTAGVNFKPQGDGTVIVSWWEVKHTPCSGPAMPTSTRACLSVERARQIWREARAEGLQPAVVG